MPGVCLGGRARRRGRGRGRERRRRRREGPGSRRRHLWHRRPPRSDSRPRSRGSSSSRTSKPPRGQQQFQRQLQQLHPLRQRHWRRRPGRDELLLVRGPWALFECLPKPMICFSRFFRTSHTFFHSLKTHTAVSQPFFCFLFHVFAITTLSSASSHPSLVSLSPRPSCARTSLMCLQWPPYLFLRIRKSTHSHAAEEEEEDDDDGKADFGLSSVTL